MNHCLLALLNPNEAAVVMRLAEERDVDELWSYVAKKHEQRWLRHAIEHRRGKVLAYIFGRRKDEVFLKKHDTKCTTLRRAEKRDTW